MTISYPLHDNRKINLTPRGAAGFAVEVVDATGALVWSDAPLDLLKQAHRKRIMAEGKVSADEMNALLAELKKPAEERKGRQSIDGVSTTSRVMLRGMKEAASKAEPIHAEGPLEAMRKALGWSTLPAEAIVYWDDALDLRVVDLDWHHGQPPRQDEVERLALSCEPSPGLWWVTHGGGLRLCYEGAGGFTAEELAACAAAYLLTVRPDATAEIKCDTRHPASLRDGNRAGEPQESLPDTVLGILGRFSKRGCTEAERDEWLANQGMHLHGKFAHHFCPIDAHHVSKSAAPVWAGDEGIYCASCAARSGDGFRSYGRLIGNPREADSPVYLAAKYAAHWNQAAYYLAAFASELPTTLHRPIYSALVKSLHQNEPRDDRVRGVFEDFGFVRGNGNWLVSDTLQPASPRLAKEDVARLSYAKRWVKNDDGVDVLRADPGLVLKLTANVPMPGLPPLSALQSCPIFGVHNPIPNLDGTVAVLPRSKAKAKQCRYIPRKDRMPLADAWAVVERYFPGINRGYFTLLHIARGYGEKGDGQLPMVFVRGPSGSSKTATSKIESIMSGDVYKDLGMGDWSRVAEAVGEAISDSGAIVVNEFAKLNERNSGAAANWVLQLGRTHTYRKLYVGSVTVPARCYVLLTDTKLPYTLLSDEQFGRRVVYVPLRSPVLWGGGGVTAETWMDQDGAQRAADAIHSWIVDEYFPPGIKSSFDVAAARLGFLTLDRHFVESEEGKQRNELAKTLFRLVCATSAATSHGEHGRGWVPAGVDNETSEIGHTLRALLALADEQESTSIPALTSALEPLYGRWHKVLGIDTPAVVEFRRTTKRVFIRFKSDDGSEKYKVNGELK